jgi:hypothetical protein
MTTETSGWVRLGALSLRKRILLASFTRSGAWIWVLFIGLQFFVGFLDDIAEQYGIAIFIVTLVLAASVILVLAVITERRNPQPEVNLAAGSMRVGREVTAFVDITDATWLALPPAVAGKPSRRTEAYLLLSGGPHRRAPFCLLSPRAIALDESDRAILVELLRASSIRLPPAEPDPYDPKGRFAHLDQRAHLTRDEAIGYVLDTPPTGEPVREPSPPKSIWID